MRSKLYAVARTIIETAARHVQILGQSRTEADSVTHSAFEDDVIGRCRRADGAGDF